MGKLQKSPGTDFQGSFPSGVTKNVLNSPSNELRQDVWNVIYLGSSLETHSPGFNWELITQVPSCLAQSRIPGPQGLSINHTVCPNNAGSLSHSYQLGWWKTSGNQRSQTVVKGHPYQQAFQRISILRPTITLFCTIHPLALGLTPKLSSVRQHSRVRAIYHSDQLSSSAIQILAKFLSVLFGGFCFGAKH